MICCQSSRLMRSMPRKIGLMPALFTSTSIRPCTRQHGVAQRQHVGLARHVGHLHARAIADRVGGFVPASPACGRPARRSRHAAPAPPPSPRPMPRPAPVTMQTFPVRSKSLTSWLHCGRCAAPATSDAPRTGRRRCGSARTSRKMRSTSVSPVTPWPPSTCTQRSTTRQIASEQNTLAIEDSVVPRAPWSSSQAVCQIDRRLMRMSISLSASMKPTPSWLTSFAPNTSRSLRVARGDVVRAPRRAEPAHAMRQPRRRQPHLRVAKALARLAENIAGRHAQIVEPHHRVAAGERLVEAVHGAHDLDARLVHVGQEHRRGAVLALRHDDGEGGAVARR